MQLYENRGDNSNIRAFEIGKDYIDVQFNGGKIYRYSYNSAGKDKIENMKKLALQGCGLNSYIMRYAKKDYVK